MRRLTEQCIFADPTRSPPCSRTDSSPSLTTCHWESSYERHKLSAAPPRRAADHLGPVGQRDVQRLQLRADQNLQWQEGNVGTN